ncbi:hypothetical protein Q31a_28570 [Aureliella helgolandensis]|uniref:Uncharacterized protein n=1 Tax=Aureliella helgolandensis TaxID=2527968 RepID=A0A518G7I1_9BACT|nr:hypothetical protein Q31a_28570 [Aureliella helgolandensis]
MALELFGSRNQRIGLGAASQQGCKDLVALLVREGQGDGNDIRVRSDKVFC